MGLLEALRRSNATERLAGLAALGVFAAMFLPWYRAPYGLPLAQSGLETFGFGQAALLLTAGAATVLISRSATGRKPPLPLHEGTLVGLAGLWSVVILVSLMLDRPRLDAGSFETDYGLAYGFIAELAAAVVLAAAGWRLRHSELSPEVRGDRSPSGASPARSPGSRS